MSEFSVAKAKEIAGSLGFPSKMPGTAYGIPATACKTGSKLAKVDGTVCSDCYALKGNYTFPSVAIAQTKRMAAIENPQWIPAMVKMLRGAHGLDGRRPHASVKDPGYHRWHDSGDVQSVSHLKAICNVAEGTPELKHWIPTKELGILKAFVAAGHVLPSNVTVRLSAYSLDAAPSKGWNLTSTVYTVAPRPEAHACPAYKQGGQCGDCRACWSRDVQEVAYPKH